MEYDPESIEDDDDVRRMYLESWLGDSGYDIYQLITDKIYARRAVMTEWLRENGYNPEDLLSFEDKAKVKDIIVDEEERAKRDELAIEACLRIWVQDQGHKKVAKLSLEELRALATEITIENNRPAPILGKQILRDGNMVS